MSNGYRALHAICSKVQDLSRFCLYQRLIAGPMPEFEAVFEDDLPCFVSTRLAERTASPGVDGC